MKSTPNLKTVLAALFIVSALATWTTSVVYGHEYSPAFRFHSSSVKMDDRTSSYATQVSDAVDDFNDNTDMTWTEAEPAEIIYLEGNWGYTGWVGAQQAKSDTVNCFTWPDIYLTGYCDDDENKADFSYIYLNTQYQDALDEKIENIVRHEPGHVLGMAHTNCTSSSVMKRSICTNYFEILRSHDIYHINDWH